ncbi:MAG: hypothetical protein FWF82_00905 [Oscillospiraceae bacterium]|nr:hypothetical protein [Oscillospiraceae bacterium]
MKKLISILITISILATAFTTVAAADSSESGTAVQSLPDMAKRDYYFPGNMRGVILRPDSDGVIADSTFPDLVSMSMNTAIIATSDSGNVYYNTDMNKSEDSAPDRLTEAVENSRKHGLNVYLVFDIDTALYSPDSPDSPQEYQQDLQSALNRLITEIHKFTLKYPCDGIILDSYYSSRDEESFSRYMNLGAGIGYDNWLSASTENFFKTAADTVRMTNNNIPVGILLDDFSYKAVSAGFADTRKFVADNHADFALLNAPDALVQSEVEIPFEEITDYWGGICGSSGTPLYVIHHNQRIGE